MLRAPVLALAPVPDLPELEADSWASMSCEARGVADVSMSNREEPLRGSSGSGSDSGWGWDAASLEVSDVEASAALDDGCDADDGGLLDDGGVARNRMDEGASTALGRVEARGATDVRATARSACLAAILNTMTCESVYAPTTLTLIDRVKPDLWVLFAVMRAAVLAVDARVGDQDDDGSRTRSKVEKSCQINLCRFTRTKKKQRKIRKTSAPRLCISQHITAQRHTQIPISFPARFTRKSPFSS